MDRTPSANYLSIEPHAASRCPAHLLRCYAMVSFSPALHIEFIAAPAHAGGALPLPEARSSALMAAPVADSMQRMLPTPAPAHAGRDCPETHNLTLTCTPLGNYFDIESYAASRRRHGHRRCDLRGNILRFP